MCEFGRDSGGSTGVPTDDGGDKSIEDLSRKGKASNSGVKRIGALVPDGWYSSGPVLHGELVTVPTLHEVGQEESDRLSNGAGESLEMTDMVS